MPETELVGRFTVEAVNRGTCWLQQGLPVGQGGRL